MMTCQEFESLGPDFERHPVSRAAAEEHLRSCPRCSTLLGSWKDLDGELRALARATSSAAAPLRVELALREAVRGLRPRPRAGRLVPVWVLGSAATAAVALFAVWYVLHSPHPPQKLANPSSSLAAQPPVDRYAVTNNVDPDRVGVTNDVVALRFAESWKERLRREEEKRECCESRESFWLHPPRSSCSLARRSRKSPPRLLPRWACTCKPRSLGLSASGLNFSASRATVTTWGTAR